MLPDVYRWIEVVRLGSKRRAFLSVHSPCAPIWKSARSFIDAFYRVLS